MPTVEEAPFKDVGQRFFQNWEKVNVEALNGLLASNFYASNKVNITLPADIEETAGFFPPNTMFNKYVLGFCSSVKFSGQGTVSGGKIQLQPKETIVLNIYPNAEPFSHWNSFDIITNTESNLSLKIVKLENNSTILSETSKDTIDKKASFDFGNNITELKELVFTIKNNSNNVIIIENINYTFTLDSRGTDWLSDGNAGLLNGKSEEDLLKSFLGMINKNFLSGILGTTTSNSITADDSKKLGGQTLAQIKNLIPLLQLNNSYDDAKNSDGQYKGSDAIFSIRMPTSLGVGKNVNGNSVTVKGIKFYLHVNLRQVDIAPNQQITSTSISYPTQGGSFVLRPFCVNSTSTPKVTASANTGYSSYTYTLRNNSTSKVTGAFYVFSLIIGFVG